MPQRMKDFGRLNSWRIYQTITTSGQEVEGPVTVPNTETNFLEILAQNYKVATIESRNNGASVTCTFKIYGTRKYMETVPATGTTFWDVTEPHWTLLDTQAAVGTETNATAVVHENKAYTYYVVTAEAASSTTTVIGRAVLSQN